MVIEEGKTWYIASFKWADHVFCTNMVLADDMEKAKANYADYEDVTIRPAESWEIESYSRKGMPVIRI